MKKTLLVLLVIAAVVFSAFAGGFHYGIEAAVDYDFNLSNEHPGTNKAQFAFKPYAYNDYFTVRLLAEWKPDSNGAHGFDYLMDFDATDFYTILESSLEYVDEISLKTDLIEFVVGKGTRDFEIRYDFNTSHANRAQLKLDIGIVKAEVYATDFYKVSDDQFTDLQYADVKVNLGLVEVEAAATRQALFCDFENVTIGKNRIIPKVGAKLKFGLANVGFYFTTDMSYKLNSDEIQNNLLDRWVLEALAEFKVGTFNLMGKFYLDNRLDGYSNVYFPDQALFGIRAEANLNLDDFFTLKMTGDLPLKLNDGLRVVRNFNKTMESLGVSFEVGTWWKIGAEVNVRGLISQIEDGDDFLTILKKAEPTITAGIYTIPLDVTASVKLSEDYIHVTEIVPQVCIGAVIRADNFLAQTK